MNSNPSRGWSKRKFNFIEETEVLLHGQWSRTNDVNWAIRFYRHVRVTREEGRRKIIIVREWMDGKRIRKNEGKVIS